MSDIKTLNGHNLVDTAATAKLNSVIETVGGTEKIKQDALPDGVKVNPTWDDIGTTKGAIIEETEFELDASMGMGVVMCVSTPSAGDSVDVTFDGQKYTRTVVNVQGTMFIGNASYVGGEDTGEPFALIWQINNEVLVVVEDTTVTTHTIKAEGSVVTAVPRKYLGNVVTEFYTEVITGDGIYLLHSSYDENTKVTQHELNSALREGTVLVSCGPTVCTPIMATPYHKNGYGLVVINDSTTGFSPKTFYTAEYTPTETTTE